MNQPINCDPMASGEHFTPLPGSLPSNGKLDIKDGPVSLPRPDEGFIYSVAKAALPNGLTIVTEYAQASAQAFNGQELEELRCATAQREDNLKGIGRQIRELTGLLEISNRYHETRTDNKPWNWLDVLQVCVYGAVSVVLLAVGLNSMARILMASGLPAFEHSLPCYLFSAIPMGLPFALKALGLELPKGWVKKVYRVLIWLAAIYLAANWVFRFGQTFSGVAQSAADIVNSLSLNSAEQAQDSKWVLTVISVFAETFLAAGCWLTIERICERHLLSKKVPNPASATLQRDLSFWRQLQQQENDYLAKIKGRIKAIEHTIALHTLRAQGLHAVATFMCRQQREFFKANFQTNNNWQEKHSL